MNVARKRNSRTVLLDSRARDGVNYFYAFFVVIARHIFFFYEINLTRHTCIDQVAASDGNNFFLHKYSIPMSMPFWVLVLWVTSNSCLELDFRESTLSSVSLFFLRLFSIIFTEPDRHSAKSNTHRRTVFVAEKRIWKSLSSSHSREMTHLNVASSSRRIFWHLFVAKNKHPLFIFALIKLSTDLYYDGQPNSNEQ